MQGIRHRAEQNPRDGGNNPKTHEKGFLFGYDPQTPRRWRLGDVEAAWQLQPFF